MTKESLVEKLHAMRVDGDRTKNRNGMTILFGILFVEEIGDGAADLVEAYNAKYGIESWRVNLTIVQTGQRLAELVDPKVEPLVRWRGPTSG